MIGLIFIFLAQIAYAFGGLVIRKYLGSYNPILISAFMSVVSFAFFLPLIIIFYRSEVGGLTLKASIPFIVAGIVWLVIAEILYNAGLIKSPSLTLASLMTLFYPLFSTILGILFLKEQLTLKTIIAAVLMSTGFVFLVI